MERKTYERFENYMLSCMADSAHDKDHVYRVLYTALDIARFETGVDYGVLICACLLHDIGRREQIENPAVCHAAVGAEKAYRFLIAQGLGEPFAEKVKACVASHRFRSETPPQRIEAKIMFDADKVDVTGAIGVARTILYQGKTSEPLYTLRPDGQVSDGTDDEAPSFFQEYKYKLQGLYDKFYTKRGAEIAAGRQAAAAAFYNSLLKEVRCGYAVGQSILNGIID